MTTATGQYVLDFTAETAESPWADANWTDKYGGAAGHYWQIVSGSPNALVPQGQTNDANTRTYWYTGSSYSGTVFAARAETGAWATGESAYLSIQNSDGTGYLLRWNYYVIVISKVGYPTDYSGTDISTSSTWAFSAGDVIEFGITCGSPNTFTVNKNGSSVTGWDNALSDSTYSITTPNIGLGCNPSISGTISIRSIGIDYGPGSSTPAITDVDGDETISPTQVGVVITGTGFGASQGTGSVKLAPTDNLAAGLTQTVTAWADTSITFTASGLPDGTGYLFVTNNDSLTNAAGVALTLVYTPIVLTWNI